MSEQFSCIALAPAPFGDPAIAVAAARAGGIGVLDLDGASEEAATRACPGLAREPGRVGLRGSRLAAPALAGCLDLLGERPHWLILSATDDAVTPASLAALARPQRRLLIEIADAEEAARFAAAPIAGLVLRGHECGGWAGEDTAFILLQKIAAGAEQPFYLQGAVGLHAAAACRAAGAAGVVLDDQLLLMPESPLPAEWKRRLAQVGGKDARVLGEVSGMPCRVLLRPDLGGAVRLQTLADECDANADGGERWRAEAPALVGWGPPETHAWPVGQGIGLAVAYRDRFKTTGRLIEAMTRQSAEQLATARRLRPLAPDSALAASHRTRCPIAQGPMTRVSDSAAFADAVSRAGALPFLALALMTGEQTERLLRDTAARLGERSWGVGLLGFAPSDIREAQIKAIWEVKPPFALVAGGRPDQAAQFEERGIAAYIHAPAPELLELFIDQGARRFVFEGRECGGHIGPLASLVLWESQIELLLRKVSAAEAEKVHVLFAGGIHDGLSAAMIAVMAAPLAERGMRVGVLVGTGYLFTEEIVSTGAVVPEFQRQALACRNTINLVSGPGHATRCADTEFGRQFLAERRRLLASGEAAETVREQLENYNLGRLRLASKGILRDRERGLVEISEARQRAEGMYMLGQVATARSEVTSLSALHAEISDGATARLDAQPAARPAAAAPRARPADIAIVGIGTLLPNALTPEDYWANIVGKIDCLSEIPPSRFDWRLYFDPDRNARDKIYAKWGGFIGEVPFDPLRYGIPPRSLASIDPIQLLTLEVVRRAIEDAGYADGDFDRENTSVIIGAGGGLGDFGLQYGVRSELPRIVGTPGDAAWDRLPEWTEESFSGSLLNVAAGRVANRFNFGGVNFTIDAACSSALAAIGLAANELETGRSNLAIAGGIDVTQGPFAYLSFCKTQALSPTGRIRTFDKHADGIVISEGLAVIVMKRLADAEQAGDRIYAVIKGVAGSSDGRALGLTAPRPEGQMRALDRAYAKAGLSPASIGLIEAHGTGTTVGDRAELETVVGTLNAAGAEPRSCAIGSVKTLIGHTKGAAGAAGLVKVALALHHRVLPPHPNVTEPLDAIASAACPVYLLKDAKPWVPEGDEPRRAAVSAFGFGGTNFHAVLEEYREEYRAGAAPLGGDRWPWELFVFRGRDKAELKRDVQHLRNALAEGAAPRLRDLALSLALRAEARPDGDASAGVTAGTLAELRSALDSLLAAIAGGGALPQHVSLSLKRAETPPKLALLFPGQGSQYVNMGREQAVYLAAFRRAIEGADRALDGRLPRRLGDYMFPPADFTEDGERATKAALTATEVAQPAIGAVSAAYLDLVRDLGLEAHMAAGHSYGEFTALHAASALSRADFLALSSARGRVMSAACNAPERGTMAAVFALREQVEPALAGRADVVVANHNAPKQVVISGAEAAVRETVEKLVAGGTDARLLPVAGAFHSPLMAPSREGLLAAIAESALAAPQLAVYANETGRPYEADADAVREQLGRHLLSPVEFLSQVEQMHADGARVFLELGPKSVLSGLVGLILKDRPHVAVALDAGGLRGTLIGLGTLFAQGLPLRPSRLFAEREAQAFDLEAVAAQRPPAAAWYVSGGWARAAGEPVGKPGRLPGLTLETLHAERSEMRNEKPEAPGAAATPRNGAAAHVNGARIEPAPTNGAPPKPVLAAAPLVTAAAPAANATAAAAAFEAYQQTMRQFLAVQERVLTQFLGAGSRPLPAVEAPGLPAILAAPPAAAIEMPVIRAEPATPAPTAAPPAAPASAPAQLGMPRDEITRVLLGLVGERTGYPAEMLGLDRDVEAELGIDSIKRVEILGGLQQRLPAELSARVSEEMEALTRVKTLSGIVERLVPASGNGHAVPRAAAPAAITMAPASMPRDEVTRVLLGLVGERTGYPAEMLGLDRDVEAELGIDSIKRVEILGGLQQRLPAELSARVSDEMDALTRVKTLSGIVERLTTDANGHAAAIAVPAAVAALAPAGMPRDEVTRVLLGLVGERTGYPAEMLGLDRDVEAELGIDSIKRVEILGGLQQRLPAELSARVSEEMEALTRVKTLSGIVERLTGASGNGHAAVIATPMAAPAAVPALAVTGMPRDEVTRVLLGLVGERTGYPAEMLGLDRDVEAELGIDSIKRVEILGGLQQRLSAELSARVGQEMEALTRVKTLSGIIDRLLTELAVPTAPTPVAKRPAAEKSVDLSGPAETAELPALPRLSVRAVAQPLSGTVDRRLSGVFVLTEDESGVAARLAQHLEEHGAQCEIVTRAQLRDGAEAIAAALPGGEAALAGIVHLAPLGRPSAVETAADWRAGAAIGVKSLFHLLYACAPQLARTAGGKPRLIVAATALGGHYGRAGAVPLSAVAGGGVHGLLKVAGREWPDAHPGHLDFDPQRDPDEIARQILDEILRGGDANEVGYPGGVRTEFRPAVAALRDADAPAIEPQADWVVLATGGARGITAELLHEIARSGMRIVLVGRSPLPGDEDAATSGLDGAELRKALMARALADNSLRTPAEIDRQFRQVLAEREMRRQMARLADVASVEYHAVDVRDDAAFAALIDGVYRRHGRIDAVLHGAGIIEDKLIRDKKAESFDRVFATKADSVFTLARHLRPDSLKLLVLFGSVAGRFGNPGQGDYAAANETLNRMAWHLRHEWPAARVVSINWGPWAASGMASKSVQRELQARGIEPIATAAGKDYFIRELRHGRPDEVELVVGAGPWAADAVDAPAAARGERYIPFAAPKLAADRSMVAEGVFDPGVHRYLDDYRPHGVPALSAAAALEWMAQFVAAAWSDWKVQAIGDFQVVQALQLAGGKPAGVRFRARASSHADAESVKVSVELGAADGDAIHYRGTATLVPELPAPARTEIGDLAAGDGLDAGSAYRDHLFHGPRLRLIEAIDRIGELGADAAVSPSRPESWLDIAERGSEAPGWLFDPGLLDTAPQLALVWARLKRGITAQPARIGAVERFGTVAPGEQLRLRLRVKSNGSKHLLVYDALFVDQDERVRLALRDVESACEAAPDAPAGS